MLNVNVVFVLANVIFVLANVFFVLANVILAKLALGGGWGGWVVLAEHKEWL